MKLAAKLGMIFFYIIMLCTYILTPSVTMFIGLTVVGLPLLPATIVVFSKHTKVKGD